MKNILLVLLLFACDSKREIKSAAYSEVISTPNISTKYLHSSLTLQLNQKVSEGSGLVGWNSYLWTHNDSGPAVLYAIDTLTGNIAKEYNISGIQNEDWEDLNQDDNYFYIGAFGNNIQKKDLVKIYRVFKAELLKERIVVDSITFSWPSVSNKRRNKKINFDCEAMAIIDEKNYLFTKEWKNDQCTKVFTLPKYPGFYTAKYKTTFKTKILITGANYDAKSNKLVLCGYNFFARPCFFVFPNADNLDILPNEGLQIIIKQLPLRQVEGIATFDGINYYLISEDLRFLFLHSKQQINK